MTDGLVILGAWLELGVVLGALGWVLLRKTEADPLKELPHSSGDAHPPNG